MASPDTGTVREIVESGLGWQSGSGQREVWRSKILYCYRLRANLAANSADGIAELRRLRTVWHITSSH